MTKLADINLFVGDINDNIALSETDWAVVHATQTIHYQLFGWNRSYNKPNKEHPNYIIYEKDNHLSLNWVDGAAYLYKWSGAATFNRILDFIDKWISERNVLIHCDQGFSRSLTICLLYLAKRKKLISNKTFIEAKNDFITLYPNYNPGGIGDFVNENWLDIR